MRSLQDYINIYRDIANNLHLSGDSVELLVQMMANSSYINEVENINYANEASLERATLLNSKIQQCVNIMYSVFRGTCPRVIIRFKSKKYMDLNLFDEVCTSNNFKLYYIGYHKDNVYEIESDTPKNLKDSDGTESIKREGEEFDNFIYAPTTIPPLGDNAEFKILCLLSSSSVTGSQSLTDFNRYYIDIESSGLSNDLYVKVNGSLINVYRKFSDHIKNGGIFDLTLPSFATRFYAPDIFRSSESNESNILDSSEVLPPSNTLIEYNIFKYCTLSEFNESELSRIKIKGLELDKEFAYKIGDDGKPTNERLYPNENYPGLTLIDASDRDSVESIHYKANRDRYSNSIIRSNYDIGVMLEEYFPDKIIKGGTHYKFEKVDEDNDLFKPRVTIYYIPYSQLMLISNSEIEQFKKDRSSYYVTDDIIIKSGEIKNIFFKINVQLYRNEKIDIEVENILKQYEDKFNLDIEYLLPEIESAISKISNVRSIINTRETVEIDGHPTVVYKSGIEYYQINSEGTYDEYKPSEDSYCKIDYNVNSIIFTRK